MVRAWSSGRGIGEFVHFPFNDTVKQRHDGRSFPGRSRRYDHKPNRAGERKALLALINTIFAQDTPEAASAQWRTVTDQLRPKFPKLADMMEAAEHDVLAYMAFPSAHRVQLRSTNPLERLNAEVKRRTNVVGIFPNERAIIRLVRAMMLEQNDEWSLQRRYMQIEGLQSLCDAQPARLSAVIA